MSRTLSCCVIAKKPSDSLTRAIESVRPYVDEVVLVWTCRATEDRPKVIGVDVAAFYDACNAQFDCPPESTCGCKSGDLLDFSMARNESFRLASGDLCTYVDSDDVVVGTGSLRELYREDVRVLFPYEYRFDAQGRCVDRQYTDRLAPKGTLWGEPVHNRLCFDPSLSAVKSDGFVWKHARDRAGAVESHSRALRLLRHWEGLVRFQNDARFVYYLGRVHLDAGILGRASEELERSFHLETHPEMRACIALDLARCWSKSPQYALEWGHRALELRPEWPGPWLMLARLYHALAAAGTELSKNARLARMFLREGLTCDPADTMVFVDPSEKEWTERFILGLGDRAA